MLPKRNKDSRLCENPVVFSFSLSLCVCGGGGCVGACFWGKKVCAKETERKKVRTIQDRETHSFTGRATPRLCVGAGGRHVRGISRGRS